MSSHRWSAHTSGCNTVVWAAKIAFCFLGVLSFGAAARATVPAASEVLASALPGFRAALRSWFAPPYLFIAIHLIILVIWKLSDQKQHPHHEQWAADYERTVEPAIKMKPFEPSPSDGLLRKAASPGIWREKMSTFPEPVSDEHSPSDASCVTTESRERSTASSVFVSKTSTETEFKRSIATAEEDDEATAAAGIENDSMEVTWKAIMEKSLQPAATQGRDARQPAAAVPASASHDELNRRFDDFIRKNHEQIRLLNDNWRRE